MYHLKVVAANIAYLATEFFPKKEGMEKMERHFFAVRALVGWYLGYPRRPQYFRIYSMNFHLKMFQNFMLDTQISNS